MLAVVLAFAVNRVIDRVGHTTRDDFPARTWITHSVYTAPAWGGMLGAAFIAIPSAALGVAPDPGLSLLFAGLGALVALGHLFLDALTQAGVYYTAGRRMAIAHFSYNNPVLNYSFIIAGLALVLAAVL